MNRRLTGLLGRRSVPRRDHVIDGYSNLPHHELIRVRDEIAGVLAG